jgi:hypothetical protein
VVRHAGRARVAALALAATFLGGCLGSDEPANPSSAGADIGAPVKLADCAHWRAAGPRQRAGTVREIREFAGGPTGSGNTRGATLADDRAYKLFQSYCERDFATKFKLYKLYTRAASFGQLQKK